MRPSPCVRPGSVPTIAAAAASTIHQPWYWTPHVQMCKVDRDRLGFDLGLGI